jgi:hypothetical protein
MEMLVSCPCGHPLASHDAGGCDGIRLRPCQCRRDRGAALEAAVHNARNEPAAARYVASPVPAVN